MSLPNPHIQNLPTRIAWYGNTGFAGGKVYTMITPTSPPRYIPSEYMHPLHLHPFNVVNDCVFHHVRPETPFTCLLPKYRQFIGAMFKCLEYDAANPPLEQKEGGLWRLKQPVLTAWSNLETLLRLILRLLHKFDRRNMLPNLQFYRFPEYFGYKNSSTSRNTTLQRIARSRDAFTPLMSAISWALLCITESSTLHQDLRGWRGKLVQHSGFDLQWIIDLENSIIADTGHPRVGGIFQPEFFSFNLDFVPFLCLFNAPFMVCWGPLGEYSQRHLIKTIPSIVVDFFGHQGFLPDSKTLEVLAYRLTSPQQPMHLPDAPKPKFFPCGAFKKVITAFGPNYERPAPPPSQDHNHTPPRAVSPSSSQQPAAPPPPPPPPSDDFPPVEPNSRQKPGETREQFFARRADRIKQRIAKETERERARQLEIEKTSTNLGNKTSIRMWTWEKVNGHEIRTSVPRWQFSQVYLDHKWDKSSFFDPFEREWDVWHLGVDMATADIVPLGPNNDDDDTFGADFQSQETPSESPFCSVLSPDGIAPSTPSASPTDQAHNAPSAMVVEPDARALSMKDLAWRYGEMPTFQDEYTASFDEVVTRAYLRFGYLVPTPQGDAVSAQLSETARRGLGCYYIDPPTLYPWANNFSAFWDAFLKARVKGKNESKKVKGTKEAEHEKGEEKEKGTEAEKKAKSTQEAERAKGKEKEKDAEEQHELRVPQSFDLLGHQAVAVIFPRRFNVRQRRFGQRDIYFVRPGQDLDPVYYLAVYDILDILDLLRSDVENDDIEGAALYFARRGMKFNMVVPSYHRRGKDASDGSRPPPLDNVQDKPTLLGERPSGFSPGPQDYAAYESLLRDFLESYKGRAALLEGGLISRIAQQFISYEDVLHSSSDACLDEGLCLWDGSPNTPCFYDDQLSFEDISFLVGTYYVSTGKKCRERERQQGDAPPAKRAKVVDVESVQRQSFWPRPEKYKGTLDFGYWTSDNETWFQIRRDSLRQGPIQIRNSAGWKSAMRFFSGTVDIRGTMRPLAERIAMKYILDNA